MLPARQRIEDRRRGLGQQRQRGNLLLLLLEMKRLQLNPGFVPRTEGRVEFGEVFLP